MESHDQLVPSSPTPPGKSKIVSCAQLWGTNNLQETTLSLKFVRGFDSLALCKRYLKTDVCIRECIDYKYLVVTQDKLLYALTPTETINFESIKSNILQLEVEGSSTESPKVQVSQS